METGNTSMADSSARQPREVRALYDSELDAYSLVGAATSTNGESCSLSVIFPRTTPGSDGPATRELLYECTPQAELRIHWQRGALAITFESMELSREFESRQGSTLIDLAMTCADDETIQGALWVDVDDTRLWLISIARSGNDWRGYGIARPYVDVFHTDNGVGCVHRFLKSATSQNAQVVLDLLCNEQIGLGLPGHLPLFTTLESSPPGARPRLAAKIGAGCHWFLLIPLEFFTKQHDSHAASWSIEWIATAKSFTRNLQERKQMARELSDLATLLNHSVVILNTYPHFEDVHLQATRLVIELLQPLQKVVIQIGAAFKTFSLRVLVNPPAAEIEAVLRAPDTWYVFADFHVESGTWQLGQDSGAFDLQCLLPGSLQHIRLLSIYHCNSIFDPSGVMHLRDSIVGTLLQAGAMRVEGSAFRENYFEFLRQLVRLVSKPQGLLPVLSMACLAAGKDFNRLLRDFKITVGDPD